MSNRKEFKWANVQTNGTAKNFGGWDAGGNPVEVAPARRAILPRAPMTKSQ